MEIFPLWNVFLFVFVSVLVAIQGFHLGVIQQGEDRRIFTRGAQSVQSVKQIPSQRSTQIARFVYGQKRQIVPSRQVTNSNRKFTSVRNQQTTRSSSATNKQNTRSSPVLSQMSRSSAALKQKNPWSTKVRNQQTSRSAYDKRTFLNRIRNVRREAALLQNERTLEISDADTIIIRTSNRNQNQKSKPKSGQYTMPFNVILANLFCGICDRFPAEQRSTCREARCAWNSQDNS